MLVSDISDREKAIEQLKAGICPFCEKGPFRRVLSHASQIHDICAKYVKDSLLLPINVGFVDKDLKDRLSASARSLVPSKHALNSGWLKGRSRDALTKEKMSRTVKDQQRISTLRKLSNDQVSEIKIGLNKGTSQGSLAKSFNVSIETISRIKKGIVYKNMSRGDINEQS